MNKRFSSLLFFLLSVFAMPAYSQATSSTSVEGKDNKLGVNINVGINYNAWAHKENGVGGSAGLEMEWRFSSWSSLGIGAGYSSESWSHKHTSNYGPNFSYSSNKNHSIVNIPLMLHLHPKEWLSFDIGLQWNTIVGSLTKTEVKRNSFSLPIGFSFGSKHSFFVRVLPRLGNVGKDSPYDDVESSQLQLGLKMRIL